MSMIWRVSLVPAGEGRPDWLLTRPLMLIGMKPNNVRTQPLAPGAAKALSTYSPSVRRRIPVASSKLNLGMTPVIGLFGGGGLVVLNVKFNVIGFELEPT